MASVTRSVSHTPRRPVVSVLPILRAIASGDLHNLVYRADYRIVPAVTAKPATPLTERTS